MVKSLRARMRAVLLAGVCACAAVTACGSSGGGSTPSPVARSSATPTPSPTVTPTPSARVLAALKDYVPAPEQIGPDFVFKPGQSGAPQPSGDADPDAVATWEAIYSGPGAKLVLLDISQYKDDYGALQAGSAAGQAPSDEKATQLYSTTKLGYADWFYKAPVKNDEEFYAVIWQEGPILFELTDREKVGVLTLDDAVKLAQVVDAKAH